MLHETRMVELEKVKKEHEKMLTIARAETLERIVAEKRGISKADIAAFLETQTWLWNLEFLTSDNVRKWLRKQKETTSGGEE